MTGQILTNGTANFTPIIEKLGDIATEFVPYLIYIAIAVLGVALTFRVVKWILGYLKGGAMGIFKDERVYYDRKRHNRDEKNGTLRPEREYYSKK